MSPLNSSSFDVRQENRLFDSKGDYVDLFPGRKCSCTTNLDANRANANCRVCKGVGYFYKTSQRILGLVTGITYQKQLLASSMVIPGDLIFSQRMMEPTPISDFDMIRLSWDGVAYDGDILTRGASSSDLLVYNATDVAEVYQSDPITGNVTTYTQGVDYSFVSGSDTITWLGTSVATAAIDAVTHPAAVSAASLTFAHTVSGANRYLVVAVYSANSPNRSTSSLLYGASSLSKLNEVSIGNGHIELWGLVAPTTGTNNVAITLDGFAGDLFAAAISFTGVDQLTAPITANSLNASLSVGPVGSRDYVFDVLASDQYSTVGAGQVEQFNTHDPSYGFSGSTKAGPGSPNTTMSWTGTTTQRHLAIAVPGAILGARAIPATGSSYGVKYSAIIDWLCFNSPGQRYERGTPLGNRVFMRRKELFLAKVGS